MSVAGRRARRIVLRVVAVVAAVVIIAGAALGIHHARHASDAKMLQGEWLVQGTDMTIVFDDDTIRFPGSVDYQYTIDTFRGRIEFTHGDRTGTARYQFDQGGNRVTLSESITAVTESTSQDKDGKTVVTTQEERSSETTVLLRISYDSTARPQLTGGIARWEQSGLGGAAQDEADAAADAAPEEGAAPEGEGAVADGADAAAGDAGAADAEAGPDAGGTWDNINERGAGGDADSSEEYYDEGYYDEESVNDYE